MSTNEQRLCFALQNRLDTKSIFSKKDLRKLSGIDQAINYTSKEGATVSQIGLPIEYFSQDFFYDENVSGFGRVIVQKRGMMSGDQLINMSWVVTIMNNQPCTCLEVVPNYFECQDSVVKIVSRWYEATKKSDIFTIIKTEKTLRQVPCNQSVVFVYMEDRTTITLKQKGYGYKVQFVDYDEK